MNSLSSVDHSSKRMSACEHCQCKLQRVYHEKFLEVSVFVVISWIFRTEFA